MMTIKTKENASLLMAFASAFIVAIVMAACDIVWWLIAIVALGVFVVVALFSLYLIKSYVAYKLKPIYSMVLSRHVPTKEIARLKQNEAFRKQYLGNVAHELKTPIFNIQGYISTLLDGGLEDDLINRKYLERAEKSIDRLINIVNDLDTISKLENDMNRLKMTRFDIAALAKDITEQLEIEAAKRNIKLSVKGADSLPSSFWVTADQHFVGQVLVNLVANSIHYGKEGGSTRIKFRDMMDKVLVEVEDTGVGISKEDMPRIFERFYRVDKSRSREQGGTGLGLAIVKHIVEAHGERITVRSEMGVGTTFAFALKKEIATTK